MINQSFFLENLFNYHQNQFQIFVFDYYNNQQRKDFP